MLSTVSFDFKSSLSDAQQALFSRNILTRLLGNPAFAGIQTPLIDTELHAAVDRYETALQEAADRSRTKIALKNAARIQLSKLLENVASRVAVIADGNEALVLDAGFKVRNQSRIRRNDLALDQVTGQRAMPGLLPGEAILEYRTVPGARLYAIEWSLDNGENWQNGVYSSTRRASVTGLPLRQDILLRVYALGAKQNKGAKSEAARVFLL